MSVSVLANPLQYLPATNGAVLSNGILEPTVKDYFANPFSHDRLISDRYRVEIFHEAIFQTVKPGDVVLDIGAGTGILSLMAASAGASRVFAFEENMNILEIALFNAKKKGLLNKIEFIPGNSKAIHSDLLLERPDVILSETIGSFAFNEGILSNLSSGKKILGYDGVLIPRSITLIISVVQIGNVLLKAVKNTHCSVVNLKSRLFSAEDLIYLSKPKSILSVDLQNNNLTTMSEEVSMLVERKGHINGILFWFDASLSSNCTITNHPLSHEECWQQSLMILPNHFEVDKDDDVFIKLEVHDDSLSVNHRINIGCKDHICTIENTQIL